jgi:hypothetical protein
VAIVPGSPVGFRGSPLPLFLLPVTVVCFGPGSRADEILIQISAWNRGPTRRLSTGGALRPGEGRDPEALSISAGSQPRGALEQAPEERRILVADAPADLVNRGLGPLEPTLRVLDTQALDVADGRETVRAGVEGRSEAAGSMPLIFKRKPA